MAHPGVGSGLMFQFGLILPPMRMTVVEIHIQVINPIAAPREPYVLL